MSMNENDLAAIPGVENLTYEEMNIIAEFQRAWIRVAFWMRAFFKSSLEDSEDLPAITAQLFQLPADFYNLFRPHFSEEDSQQLYNILYDLVYTNYKLVNGYKNNDRATLDSSTVQWYQGAIQLSAFLASIDKYWDEALWNSLLSQYGKLKIEEIIAYYNKEYEKEIQIYNSLENNAVLIGRYMARGIIAKNAAASDV